MTARTARSKLSPLFSNRSALINYTNLRRWWSEMDVWILSAALLLIGIGIVMGLATSPIRAARVGVEPFYYVKRHAVFLIPALMAMFGCATLSNQSARRFGVVLFGIMLMVMAVTPIIGQTINGSTRWISFGIITLQPAEFYKVAFIMTVAWMMASREDPTAPPTMSIALGLLVISVFLLYLQPDFGQTVLVCLTWGVMFFTAGAALAWAGSAIALAAFGAAVVYAAVPYVRARVDAFLFSSDGGFDQMRNARLAIEQGGFFGRGPGEGYYKTRVPDVDSDFVFAAAIEEYGLAIAVVVLGCYALISIRALLRVRETRDSFTAIAVSGLAVLFAAQALIHTGVSVQLLPAKGMTLPFVSNGGSSLVASGILVGLLLALTRRRPQTGLEAMMRETR